MSIDQNTTAGTLCSTNVLLTNQQWFQSVWMLKSGSKCAAGQEEWVGPELVIKAKERLPNRPRTRAFPVSCPLTNTAAAAVADQQSR